MLARFPHDPCEKISLALCVDRWMPAILTAGHCDVTVSKGGTDQTIRYLRRSERSETRLQHTRRGQLRPTLQRTFYAPERDERDRGESARIRHPRRAYGFIYGEERALV